jgi:hypothetical protein
MVTNRLGGAKRRQSDREARRAKPTGKQPEKQKENSENHLTKSTPQTTLTHHTPPHTKK